MTHNNDTNYFTGRDLAPARADSGILLVAATLGTLLATSCIIILLTQIP